MRFLLKVNIPVESGNAAAKLSIGSDLPNLLIW